MYIKTLRVKLVALNDVDMWPCVRREISKKMQL